MKKLLIYYMTSEIMQWLQQIKQHFNISPSNILEVGSMNVNGSPREIFPEVSDYLGVDQSAGPGVDMVVNAHQLDLNKMFDCVISCESLEHDSNPILTIEILRKHAYRWLIVTTPSQEFGIHRYPRDYWRILPDMFQDVIFKNFKILNFMKVPSNTYCCVGEKIFSNLLWL